MNRTIAEINQKIRKAQEAIPAPFPRGSPGRTGRCVVYKRNPTTTIRPFSRLALLITFMIAASMILSACSSGDASKSSASALTPDPTEDEELSVSIPGIVFPDTTSGSSSRKPGGTELPPSSFLPEVPRIDVHDVKRSRDQGVNMIILDSRLGNDYDKSRIPGAIHLTLDNMAEPYTDFETDELIVTYCT